jgi:hypothetical protein
MFKSVDYINGRVNIIEQPNTENLFKLYDQNKTTKTSFRDALKGSKQSNDLSDAFFGSKNIQIVQNGLRAGVYKMSQNKFVLGEQSYDSIKVIMQDIYTEHVKNHPTRIAEQIQTLNQHIFDKYVPKLYNEVIGYIKYKEDVSTIKEPIYYPKPSGDRDFKNLEYKNW